MAEHHADFLLDDLVRLALGQSGAVLGNQTVDPIRVNRQVRAFAAAGVGSLAAQDVGNFCALGLEACGQNGKPHHLDQTDVFFLDVVVFLMRVEDTIGEFLAGAVVAQRQVQNKAVLLVVVQNRRHGVVGGVAGAGKDAHALVAVIAPRRQNVVGNILQLLAAASHQTHRGNWPIQDTGAHAGVAHIGHRHGNVRLLHGEHIPSALEVAVAQDAAADNGQICVGAAGVMGELRHKIKDFRQRLAIHLHGLVAFMQHNAMLVEIGVGAVLQIELLTCQLDGYNAVGLAGREVDAPGVADVFLAQHTGGVAALGLQTLQRNGLGVFFGLGQVDGDFQLAVGGFGVPLDVLGNLRGADIVGHHAQVIEPIGGNLGALFVVKLFKLFADLALARHQGAHQAGFKVDAVLIHAAVQKSLLGRKLDHLVQQRRRGFGVFLGQLFLAGGGQRQQIQQRIARHDLIQILDELMLAPKAQQAFYIQRKAGVTLFRGPCSNIHK